jgi:tetratricopeptide (TPR) repeat protein
MSTGQDTGGCTDPGLGQLLGRYEFGAVDQDERFRFEKHVLECDACFAELARGAPVAAHMRAHAGELLAALNPAAPSAAPRKSRMPAALERAARTFAIPALLLRPRLLAPAFAVVMLGVLGVWFARGPDPAGLASFGREPVAPDLVRGPGSDDAVHELMQTGAAHFDLGQYAEAERRFRAALERRPASAPAAYLAGLSRALMGDPRGAVGDLERAARLADPDLAPRANWALANAYLAAGRLDDARAMLRDLSAGGGPLAGRARALLQRLED